MTRVLGIELRRGVGIAMALPMLLITAGIIYAERRSWAGNWDGWVYNLRAVLFLVGPLVLAAGVWQGGREQRRNLVELLDSTPVSRVRRAVVAVVSPLGWGILVVVVVAAGMAGVVARNTSYGAPPLGVFASVLAAVIMFAAVGYALGRAWSWRLAAPVVALAAFIVLGVLEQGSNPLRFLSPSLLLDSFQQVPTWWPLALAAAFVLTGLGALLLTSNRHWWGVPILALAVVAVVPVLAEGQDAITVDAAGQELVCGDGTPQVCLTRVNGGQLPQVSRAVQLALAGLDETRPIEELPATTDEFDPTVLGLSYVEPDLFGNSQLDNMLFYSVAQSVVSWECSDPGTDRVGEPDDAQLETATDDIRTWIAERPNGAEPAGVLTGRSDAQAVDVTNAFSAAAKVCDEPAARAALGAS